MDKQFSIYTFFLLQLHTKVSSIQLQNYLIFNLGDPTQEHKELPQKGRLLGFSKMFYALLISFHYFQSA